MSFPEFVEFQKIGRLSRDVVITEKIDGTNGVVMIDDHAMYVGSRSRWLARINADEIVGAQLDKKGRVVDNFGFAQWCFDNRAELFRLGDGSHFGEWWGSGIQRGYGMTEKRWSLFNVSKWSDDAVRPACCHVVPTLYHGEFDTQAIMRVMDDLASKGSWAAPGFMKPEGVVIFHAQARVLFKKTFDKDDAGKGREPIAEIVA